MIQHAYIRPIGIVPGPQAEHGNAIRLAGGMGYASRFAVVLRQAKEHGGEVVDRWLAAPDTMAEVLAQLPDDVAGDAEEQWANLTLAHPALELGARTVRLDQPQVMGILNVTPDSFSDGGSHDSPDAAREHAAAMVEAGASIIDVGGESTRPGAKPVWEGDEIARVVPAIEAVAGMGAAVSVDTRKAAVMEAAIEAGAALVNDVSGLTHDPRAAEVVARAGVPVVLMHAPGSGEDLHEGGDYANVVLDVFDALRARRDVALEAGIEARNILLDPGIGFGKSLAENLALINALPLFHALGHPLLLGASRKRMIGALSNEAEANARLGGSVTLAVKGMDAGVQLHRVHDVPETVQARNVWRGLRDAALTDFGDLPG
ncbi:dihydropteroate synthase [Qipengyuania sp. G39]|uniref:dihydropteroate synthase n=1 Tax=Qipengyuania profundimaris TaxID=3067652 RepID=A0ABT9HNE3_9SPHN|nr:dihydropteroate synthase [Qipengyuania sp. G39]MDP4574663.1 dihydropteroate synthase [Qipengyuania sp. G39]